MSLISVHKAFSTSNVVKTFENFVMKRAMIVHRAVGTSLKGRLQPRQSRPQSESVALPLLWDTRGRSAI